MKELDELFAESAKWAELRIPIEEISKDNQALVEELKNFETNSTISLLASLLTLPEYQSNCIRLEILATLAVIFCSGKNQATLKKISQWYSLVGKSKCVKGEDPAEDVFISLVKTPKGSFSSTLSLSDLKLVGPA